MSEHGRFWKVDIVKKVHIALVPDILVIWGDNLAGVGFGGQAAECRGVPGTLGIPTKRLPSMEEKAFFTDEDYDEVAPIILEKFGLAREHLLRGQDVAYPTRGIGTGRARLLTRAPKILDLIEEEARGLMASASEVGLITNLYMLNEWRKRHAV